MELFKLLGTIAIDNQEAIEEIDQTNEKASGLSEKLKGGITTAAKWGTAIGAGAIAASAGVLKLATDSAATADEVDKMSQKIGLSKQGYQEWSYVLGQNGMDISSLQMGMKTLVTQMDGVVSGTASSVELFDKLGLSVTDSTGAMKDQETMMKEVMIALADMPEGTEKARLANELFGRSGSELMPMLNQGSEAMLDLTQRAHDLGLIMSDETVTAGVVLGDTMDDVKKSAGMIATTLGAQLMPVVQSVLDWLLANMPTIKQTVSDALTTIGTLIQEIQPIVQTVFEGIGVLWETVLKPVFSGILDFINGVFAGDWEKAWGGIAKIFEGIWNGIWSALRGILNSMIGGIERGINGAIDAINRLIEGLNSLVRLAGRFIGLNVTVPSISRLNLPRLERGGILGKGQMGLLEGNGAEAVVPLDRNSAWISAVARDMESAGIGGNNAQTQRIIDLLEMLVDMLPDAMKDAFSSMKFDVNNREFARLVKAVN